MPVLARDALGHGHGFFFGLVRQHGAAHHVAHGPHAGQAGAALFINHDVAAFAQLQTDGFGIQPFGIGHAADRDDEFVHHQCVRFACGIGVVDGDAFFAVLDFAHVHAQLDF